MYNRSGPIATQIQHAALSNNTIFYNIALEEGGRQFNVRHPHLGLRRKQCVRSSVFNFRLP